MKEERRITVLSIVLDAITTFAKIYAGLIFNSYTLMTSGYNTLSDMIIDFMGFSGSVIRGRRASRREPFGYGKIENYATIFVGFIISILSLFIIIKSFFLKFVETDLKILLVLLIIVVTRLIYSNILFKNAKSIQSEMLMDISHASYYDAVCSAASVFFIFLGSIIPVFDLFGSLLFGINMAHKGINIIINNLISLNCQNDQSKKVIKKIEDIIKDGEGITYSNCNLINNNKFYKVVIEILIDDDVTLHDLVLWEEYLKGNIKSSKLNIKYVEFLIYKK